MEENLTCQLCSKSWTRIRTRGRKPRFCPDCVVINMSDVTTQTEFEDDEEIFDDEEILDDEILDDEEIFPEEEEEDIDSIPVIEYQKPDPNKKKTWVCPSCKHIMTTYTELVESPVCGNVVEHNHKYYDMVEYTRKKEALVFRSNA